MARDPLPTVLKVRRMALDAAKRDLAASLRLEDAAEQEERAARSSIDEQAEAATRITADDGLVEAFAAWLPRGRARLLQAGQAAERARAETARLRAALSATHAAVRVVEQLIETQDAERAVVAGRKEQAELDEVARRPRG